MSTQFHNTLSPNVEMIVEALGAGYLSILLVESRTVDHRILCLTYKCIEGVHSPKSVNQFASVLDALHQLHSKDYVHGDIRSNNLVFHADGRQAWIIDFDLAGNVGEKYPTTYNSRGIPEHHRTAMAGYPRKKEHDLYASSVIIQTNYGELPVVSQLQGCNPNIAAHEFGVVQPYRTSANH